MQPVRKKRTARNPTHLGFALTADGDVDGPPAALEHLRFVDGWAETRSGRSTSVVGEPLRTREEPPEIVLESSKLGAKVPNAVGELRKAR